MDNQLSMIDTRRQPVPWPAVAAGASAVALVAFAVVNALAAALVVAVVAVGGALVTRLRAGSGLQVDQIERLRRAELALAGATSTEAAARELADHAMALLGAPHATVLIEGIGDTVRVTHGDAAASVYSDGSRMRLLEDAGVPCGSIAVSARADGRPYTQQQERMLDALAQRVSATLTRLSLFTSVQAERRTLADVLESSSDGIFTVGLDMMVRTWNPAMGQITQVPAKQAVGQPVSSVFRPMGEDGEPRFGQADPGRRDEASAAFVSIDCAGEQRWLTCSWSPLSEGGYVVVARDETERKKLQDDKDGWVAQVTHELRTPLTPIKGFLQTLQRRDAEFGADERQRIYEVMLREELRLEKLVTSLLQATSIDRGNVAVAVEAVDWRELLTEQVDEQRRSFPTHDIELTTTGLGRGATAASADRELAAGVVAQLLSNALKYAPDGSTVHIDAHTADGLIVTTVRDLGPGVPPSDRERIFDKFTRLGDHLTRPQQGVGLGLFIARQNIRRMGGDIWCDEADGGGALFGFSLPLHKKAPTRAKLRAGVSSR